VMGTVDAYFQGKAEQRMRELCARGKALLFVSHSTPAIVNLCERVLWLDNGMIRLDGSAQYAVQRYVEDSKRQEDLAVRAGNAADAHGESGAASGPLEQLFSPHVVALRIVSESGPRFAGTHYVADISATLGGAEAAIPIDRTEYTDAHSCAHLVVLGTEWGRVHERRGRQSRSLSARAGRLRGGLFALKRDDSPGGRTIPLEVIFESQVERGEENLAVEYLDLHDGDWKAVPLAERTALNSGWTTQRFRGAVAWVDASQADAARAAYVERHHPGVVIAGVEVRAEGAVCTSIAEGEPFEIAVSVKVQRRTSIADVCVKIDRSDGVYVFWQSSGMICGNYEDLDADFVTTFEFARNFLGFGQYLVSAFVANGWDPEANFPHSQMFDRKVNAARFTVARGHARLDRGLINETVNVRIDRFIPAQVARAG
jgi:lipopolysaccharide transport system ATP-binding protein